jgi:hypothetical protein
VRDRCKSAAKSHNDKLSFGSVTFFVPQNLDQERALFMVQGLKEDGAEILAVFVAEYFVFNAASHKFSDQPQKKGQVISLV